MVIMTTILCVGVVDHHHMKIGVHFTVFFLNIVSPVRGAAISGEIRQRVLAGASDLSSGGYLILKAELISFFGPQIRRGYPPNLSISFSGGKETKEDSPSNGERTGTKPSTEPHILWMSRNVVFGSTVFLSIFRPPSPLERGPFPKRVIGPCAVGCRQLVSPWSRVACECNSKRVVCSIQG